MEMKKLVMEMQKELSVEVRANKSGQDLQKLKKKDKIMGYFKMIPGLIFFYFLFKN